MCFGNPERSEIPSGMCAKFHTVTASNNRDHASQSLLLLLARATYIMVLFFMHIPFVLNHTINATPPERLQQHPVLFTTNRTDHTFFVWRLNLARPSHPGHSNILLRSEIPSGMCAKAVIADLISYFSIYKICESYYFTKAKDLKWILYDKQLLCPWP